MHGCGVPEKSTALALQVPTYDYASIEVSGPLFLLRWQQLRRSVPRIVARGALGAAEGGAGSLPRMDGSLALLIASRLLLQGPGWNGKVHQQVWILQVRAASSWTAAGCCARPRRSGSTSSLRPPNASCSAGLVVCFALRQQLLRSCTTAVAAAPTFLPSPSPCSPTATGAPCWTA